MIYSLHIQTIQRICSGKQTSVMSLNSLVKELLVPSVGQSRS